MGGITLFKHRTASSSSTASYAYVLEGGGVRVCACVRC